MFGEEKTLAAQRLAQQESQFAEQQAVAEAGLTGTFDGYSTLAAHLSKAQEARLEEQFRQRDPVTMALSAKEAGLFDDDRLSGRIAEMALQSAINIDIPEGVIINDDSGYYNIDPNNLPEVFREGGIYANLDPNKYYWNEHTKSFALATAEMLRLRGLGE
jgi:hypothetical protein